MKDHQIKRESSDTFGRNPKADLALLRRVNAEKHSRDQIGGVMTVTVIIAIAAAIIAILDLSTQ